MDKSELREYIKNNLTISVNEQKFNADNRKIVTELKLEGQVISQGEIILKTEEYWERN